MARPWKELGRYGSVGLELVLTILILAGVGGWLDARYWGGRGWGASIGFVLGVAVAFRNLAVTARQMQRDIERAEALDPQAGHWKVDEGWLHPPPDDTRDVAPARHSDHKGPGEKDDGHGPAS